MFQSVKCKNKPNATENGYKTMVCIVALKVKSNVALKTVVLWIIKDKNLWEHSIGEKALGSSPLCYLVSLFLWFRMQLSH